MRKYGKLVLVIMLFALLTFWCSVMKPSDTKMKKVSFKYSEQESSDSLSDSKRNSPLIVPQYPLLEKSVGNQLEKPKVNNITGGFWKSGLPFMNLERKLSPQNFDFKTISDIKLDMGTVGDLHLPFQKLLADVSVWTNQSDNAFFTNRASVERFKPGVLGINLILSDIYGEKIYYFPYFIKYEEYLKPILSMILGENPMEKVIRLQFARLSKGAQIKPHQDTGNWARNNHRIHVPITVTPQTKFKIYLKNSDEPDLLKYNEG